MVFLCLVWPCIGASLYARYVDGQEIVVDGGFASMLMSLVPRPGFERGN